MVTALRHVRGLAQRNPIPNGCVLYLPLWSDYLRGTTFRSLDNFRRLCTVTGATKVGKGRDFDGNDDIITLASAPVASGNYSLFMWVNSDAQDETGNSLLQLTTGGWNFHFGGSGANYTNKYGVEGTSLWQGTSAITTATWTFVGYSLTGNNYSFVLNGVADGVVAGTANIPGTVIGSRSGTYFFNGKIGEVIVISRPTVATEWAQIYRQTTWRFL